MTEITLSRDSPLFVTTRVLLSTHRDSTNSSLKRFRKAQFWAR